MGLIRKLGSKSAMAAARSAVKQVKAMGLERPHQRTQNLAVSYWVTMDFFIDSISGIPSIDSAEIRSWRVHEAYWEVFVHASQFHLKRRTHFRDEPDLYMAGTLAFSLFAALGTFPDTRGREDVLDFSIGEITKALISNSQIGETEMKGFMSRASMYLHG